MKKHYFFLFSLLILLLFGCNTPAEEPAAPTTTATAAPTKAAEDESAETAVAENEQEGGEETEESPAYLNPELPVAERVEDLLGRMTLAEKIGQMTLIEKGSIQPTAVTDLYIGAILSGGGGSPSGSNTPEAWAAMVSSYQEAALATRLGIPIIYGVDAVHGHSNLRGATIFPHNIGLGATRNPDLLEAIGQATAVETTATGIPWNYAPVLAVGQDMRWGRYYEIYGEDPQLVSDLGAAYIRGLQGDDLADPATMLATAKHFVGDGGTAFGSSTTSGFKIDQGDTQVDEETLRRIHIFPYEAALDAGAQSVMVSFSSWNGTKMHGHDYLLNDVLKGEMGFSGFIVSDWKGIDQITRDYYTAVVTAVNAGIDMSMEPYDAQKFIGTVTRAVESGDISEERIDDAVRRILTAKFNLGLFENPFPDPAQLDLIASDEHLALAQEAVSQSLVLLQNENDTVPIAKDAKIFVAGPAADNVGSQSGGWTIEWQGKEGNITPGITILEGIEATAVGEVAYDKFAKFDEFAPPADVGIVVLAEKPYAEGHGDADDLSLSESEIELINRMNEQAEKVVVVLISGRPLIITEQLPLADAWIAAWLPGSEGQGIADNLFGDHLFTGKLPVTWPASMDQLPLGSTDDPPLFPYGFGLTTDEQ